MVVYPQKVVNIFLLRKEKNDNMQKSYQHFINKQEKLRQYAPFFDKFLKIMVKSYPQMNNLTNYNLTFARYNASAEDCFADFIRNNLSAFGVFNR